VGWKDLWIRVQYSPKGDDGKKCGDQAKPPPQCPGNYQPPDDSKTSEVEAYSDPLGTYSKITFCNRFFNKINSLRFVVSTASYGPEDIKILANYEAVGKGGFYNQRNGKLSSSHNVLRHS
jgi:hypothetical protein